MIVQEVRVPSLAEEWKAMDAEIEEAMDEEK
jgi:hypothetical protein